MVRAACLPVALLLISSPAAAQTVTSIESANPMRPPAAKSDLDKMVCEKVVRTGSRLTVDKVCMTELQWQEHKEGHRHDTEKVQQVVNQNPSH